MECISKLFGRVRHCFSHSTVGSSKTRQITIRGLELNTTNHDMRSIGLMDEEGVPIEPGVPIPGFDLVEWD